MAVIAAAQRLLRLIVHVGSRSLLLDPLRSSLRAGTIRRQRTSLAHTDLIYEGLAELRLFGIGRGFSFLANEAPFGTPRGAASRKSLGCRSLLNRGVWRPAPQWCLRRHRFYVFMSGQHGAF